MAVRPMPNPNDVQAHVEWVASAIQSFEHRLTRLEVMVGVLIALSILPYAGRFIPLLGAVFP